MQSIHRTATGRISMLAYMAMLDIRHKPHRAAALVPRHNRPRQSNPRTTGTRQMSDLGTIAAQPAWNRPSTPYGPTTLRLVAAGARRPPDNRPRPAQRADALRPARTRRRPGHGRTNRTIYAAAKVSFHIWSDAFDIARTTIAPLIHAAFASMAFDWGSGGVLDMKWDGPPTSRQTTDPEIKAWETTVSFTCTTWQTRTDATNPGALGA